MARPRTKPRLNKIQRKGLAKQRRATAKVMKRLAVDRANNGGAPTTYDPDFARQAKLLCERGATDAELADFFGVTIVTIWNWGTRHQEFFNSVMGAKDGWDKRIERALSQRASGYSFESEKIFVGKGGKVTRVPVREHVPPSEGAMKLWLTNRKPLDWKDRTTTAFDPDMPLKVIVSGGLPPGK
jgi:hypothetical protein